MQQAAQTSESLAQMLADAGVDERRDREGLKALGREKPELDTFGQRQRRGVAVPARGEETDDLSGAVVVPDLEQLINRLGGDTRFLLEFAEDGVGGGFALLAPPRRAGSEWPGQTIPSMSSRRCISSSPRRLVMMATAPRGSAALVESFMQST